MYCRVLLSKHFLLQASPLRKCITNTNSYCRDIQTKTNVFFSLFISLAYQQKIESALTQYGVKFFQFKVLQISRKRLHFQNYIGQFHRGLEGFDSCNKKIPKILWPCLFNILWGVPPIAKKLCTYFGSWTTVFY